MSAPAKRQPIPFGKYLLLDRINIGGMAEVWRGKMFGAGGFERLVAIKRILPNIAEDEEFIMMFLDEAKITVQLTHANIAQVYELDKIASSYYIAMEYVPGKDMRAIFDRCRKKGEPAPVPLTCFLVAKMCEGLDYAHRKKDGMGRDMNIVHRDISPQNVLVSYEGEVKVIDFGIAKAAGKAVKTQAGILKGKFAYMSPEQIRGLPLDRRSDVFAIGVCLYEMLTGERLFVGDSDFSVLEKVRKAEVLPPSTFNRRIPEALEKIVLKALAKDVEDRYQYASDLADDLQKFLITSDSIFSRKDLMQYMKSTFAEDVEREKLRIQEYADVKPTEGMLAALEMGFGSPPSPVVPHPAAAPIPLVTSQPAAHARPSTAAMPAASAPPVLGPPLSSPAAPPAPAVAARRSPSLAAMPVPKLTAAAPLLSNQQDDEGGATVLVDGANYFNEPSDAQTSPGELRGHSPTLTPAAPAGFMPDPSPSTAVVGPPSGVHPSASSTPVGQRITGSHPSPVAQPRPAPRAPMQAPLGRAVATPPMPPPPEDEEVSVVTTPTRRPHPQMDAEELTVDTGVGPAPMAPMGLAGSKMKLIAGIAAALVLLLIGVGVVLLKGPGEGNLYLRLPRDLAQKARVNINGVDLDPADVRKAELLKRMPAGPAAVMIAAEGWETYTGTIEVKAGNDVTRFEPQFKRLVQTTQLIVVSDPDDAEVRINGSVVKKLGDKSGPYIGEIAVGADTQLEVRSPGHKPFTKKVSAESPDAPVKVPAKLESMEYQLMVDSQPSGARIFVGSREMGETPRPIVVLGDTSEVTLKKKCFDDLVVPVKLPVQPGGTVQVSGKLVKQPRCR